MMEWLCCVLLASAILFSASAKGSFLLTGPKLFDIGTKETVILTFFDEKYNGKLQIRLLNSTGIDVFKEVTVSIENGTTKAVELPIPSSIPDYTITGKLQVIGSLGDYNVNKTVDIGFRNPKPIVFVNTDKPLYKAGQTVKIRVLVVDGDLRSVRDAQGEMWITDPQRIRVAQWTDISFGQGLLHRELNLPEEPVLGTWIVRVKINDKYYDRHFYVQEYVLPPFEVKIIPPPYVLNDDKSATWTICAKYVYGKPVKGDLLTRLSLTRYHWEKEYEIIENETKIDGCVNITIAVEGLLQDRRYYARNLELFAEVTESGTGTKINSTGIVHPSDYKFTISRDERDRHTWYFKPHIPLRITMLVKTPDSKPLSGEPIQVCVETVKQKWNKVRTVTDSLTTCKNYTSNKYGYVIFTIPSQDSNTVSINVEAVAVEHSKYSEERGMTQPRDSFSLSPWFSKSGTHLQLEKLPAVDCSVFRPNIKIKQVFHYTFNEPGTKKIFYQIMARGEIIEYGDFDIVLEGNNGANFTDSTYLPADQLEMCADDTTPWELDVQSPEYVGKFYYSMRISRDIVPRVHVLLYTVTDDGEVVADSMWYDIDLCFEDKIKMDFSDQSKWPGSSVGIHLKTEPYSLCSLSVVDKSVYLLRKADLLSALKVSEGLKYLDTTHETPPVLPTPNYLYCIRKTGDKQTESTYSGYIDTITAFAGGGGIVLTDLELETRPCTKDPKNYRCPELPARPYEQTHFVGGAEVLESDVKNRIGISGDAAIKSQSKEPTVTVRSNFPETWLFDLYSVEDSGEVVINQTMPDSITEWQGTAVCVHPQNGLAISEPASITAFQAFFASLTLPYSVIRNETVPIVVTIFNYLQECLPIRLYLDQTEEFVILNDTLSVDMCVCSDESETRRFFVKPIKLGQINITVTAVTAKDQDICGNATSVDSTIERSDTLTKQLLVEPEGFLKEETTNTYFCLEDAEDRVFRTEHSLDLPDDVVEGSTRAFSSITGDLMGPTLEGLGRLLRMPTGCGEQNMIGLVPNIVVLDYLGATNRLTETIINKAVNNIHQGYARQQKYKRSDGSYSAFGERDKEGSIWLTAFVLRSFASARRYINFPERELETSRNWILSRQKDNGCFPIVGTVHNQAIKGGVAKDDENAASLTAYIVVSMLESRYVSPNDSMVTNSFRCIEAKSEPSNYSLALFAYAASLANHPSASNYIGKLFETVDEEDLWKMDDRSIRVETAAYVLLALLRQDGADDFQKASKIAKWLVSKRSAYGGFYSTQDTVVALQALGEYGTRLNRQDLDMEVVIMSADFETTLRMNEKNELLTQVVYLKVDRELENYVEIEAVGTGCAFVQTVLRYNLPTPEPITDFELSIETEKSPGNCRKASIGICVSYNFANVSNMAIIEVKMVSGYAPVKSTLEKLQDDKDLEVKRYEIKNDFVNLYFQSLTRKRRCFSIDVTQEIEVLDVKPAHARVYDYYNNENVVSVPYSIEETCS